MQFLPQRAVKGQVVADFLAEHSDSRATKLYEDLPDEVTEACMLDDFHRIGVAAFL